jgi:hypothetical protein
MDIKIKEKRSNSRKKVNDISIKVKPLDPQVWFRYWSGTECSLRDLSLGGIGVCAREHMPQGSRISIDLLLKPQLRPIKIFGKVVWTITENKTYRSGISFSWWKSEEDKKLVNAYLEEIGEES